jgi:hypothetical protein
MSYYPDDVKCQHVFAKWNPDNCEGPPKWSVRSGAHNNPTPMCTKHMEIEVKDTRNQGYYTVVIPIEEENGKHPERDPESMLYLRNKAYTDSTDRYVVRCNDFEAASKYAAANGWEKREWSWFPAYTLNKTIQVFERKV